MPRSRNLKPSLFKNEILGTADPLLTILFEGLWCLADREGRLEDRPLRIKAEILPYRDNIDINGYLTVLEQLEFIHRYKEGKLSLIQVLNFKKHQNPHHTERKSILPEKSSSCKLTVKERLNTGDTPADSLLLIPDNCIKEKNKQKRKVFTKPTVEQIANYCLERNNGLDPQKVFDHYEANGWMRGKTKIKDWKACVRTWEKDRPMNDNPLRGYR